MKLLRFGPPGRERPGILAADRMIRDLSGVVRDLSLEWLSPEGLARLRAVDLDNLPVVGGTPRLGPPVQGVRKIVGIGLNYRDHAREAGMPEPNEPPIFLKVPSCLCGPTDAIPLPPNSTKLDYEVELAVVIGNTARQVSVERALDYVAGYAVMNDVSEREWQLERGGQWDKGKNFDNFAPFGPWLVTADEVKDPQKLKLWCEVNGERRQDGSTADMIFPVAELVSYVSTCMTLQPGDVITTGTPAGVGLGFKPQPKFLKAGDVVTLSVEGLGMQRQEIAG